MLSTQAWLEFCGNSGHVMRSDSEKKLDDLRSAAGVCRREAVHRIKRQPLEASSKELVSMEGNHLLSAACQTTEICEEYGRILRQSSITA